MLETRKVDNNKIRKALFVNRRPLPNVNNPMSKALSHTYAVKSPLVTMARPKFAPKSTPSRGPIPKHHYLPHPWTRPNYDAKRHPDPICRFAAMHWAERPTDRPTHVRTYGPTDRPRESLTTIGRCATRAMRPNNKFLSMLSSCISIHIQMYLLSSYLFVNNLYTSIMSPQTDRETD